MRCVLPAVQWFGQEELTAINKRLVLQLYYTARRLKGMESYKTTGFLFALRFTQGVLANRFESLRVQSWA